MSYLEVDLCIGSHAHNVWDDDLIMDLVCLIFGETGVEACTLSLLIFDIHASLPQQVSRADRG